MDTAFDGMKFELQEESHAPTRIKVIGVGGAGCNAVSRIAAQGPAGAEYYILNTDPRALDASPVRNKHLLGAKTIGGRGTGANPAVGMQAALDDTEAILGMLEGADLVILAVGLGGGTGTGAAPTIASLAREMNALTIGVVTKPFSFEGPRKMEIAEKGLEELSHVLDNVLIVPNDRLLDIAPRGTSFKDALRMVDDVLAQAVNGIGDIVLRPGIINRDFSDVKATLSGMGTVRLGSATASGKDGVVEAARKAIECPMLDAHGIAGARVVLLHVMGSMDLQLHDVYDATEFIRKAANNPDLHVNLGLSLDESLAGKVQVTVIATSFDEALMQSAQPMAPLVSREPLPGPLVVPAPVVTPVASVFAMPARPQPAATPEASTPARPAPVFAVADDTASRMQDPFEDTRELVVSEIHPQPEPDLQGSTAAADAAPLLFESAHAQPALAPDSDANLFDLDDLDTPAFLRQGGSIPD
ncbi:MAG: cell division protein FtsZ [Bryobacterales bacterium]|jgi:cell division protein FtsZ|nr:cell division protein FtsZ [Bryobacterales bacterium]